MMLCWYNAAITIRSRTAIHCAIDAIRVVWGPIDAIRVVWGPIRVQQGSGRARLGHGPKMGCDPLSLREA